MQKDVNHSEELLDKLSDKLSVRAKQLGASIEIDECREAAQSLLDIANSCALDPFDLLYSLSTIMTPQGSKGELKTQISNLKHSESIVKKSKWKSRIGHLANSRFSKH